jgi:hypothetical protein
MRDQGAEHAIVVSHVGAIRFQHAVVLAGKAHWRVVPEKQGVIAQVGQSR